MSIGVVFVKVGSTVYLSRVCEIGPGQVVCGQSSIALTFVCQQVGTFEVAIRSFFLSMQIFNGMEGTPGIYRQTDAPYMETGLNQFL